MTPRTELAQMRKVNLNGNTLTVYDSIDELPIVNFSRYNKFLLIDSGVGSDLEDIDNHIDRVIKYIKTDPQMAVLELQNMRQSMYFVNQKVTPKHLAFAALVQEVNGVRIENTSDDYLQELLDKIQNANITEVNTLLESLKKKLDFELLMFFPEVADSPREKEIYELLKKRTELALDTIISDVDNADAIDRLDTEFSKINKPKSFSGRDSVELKYVKDFERSCILITQEIGLKAKDLSTLQFYLALDQIKKDRKHGKQPAKVLRPDKR